MTLVEVLAISLGGAAGALSRAVVGRWIRTDFPFATLAVNVIGSFLLALFYTQLPTDSTLPRALLASGFCGALTTFSTFILEAVILYRAAQKRQAALYVAVTLFLCCLASWLGMHLF